MKLDIILRTHSTGNVHGQEPRIKTDSKEEIVLKCALSLVSSINNTVGQDIEIVVVDDHSSESCLSKLKKILASCAYPSKIINLEGEGNNASLLFCYEYARDNARDVIYFAEDDYLHFPSALPEMIESYETFKKNLGGIEVSIMPNDDPDNYAPGWIHPSYIVLGGHRHWRTNDYTYCTFMVSKDVLIKHFDLFMGMTQYGKLLDIHENTTINNLWKGPVQLFTPIPTLAVHMHKERTSPFTDWEKLWNSIDITNL